MSATGPSTPTYKNAGLFDPTNSYEYTVGASDLSVATVFNCGYAQRLVMNTAGTVYVKRAGDAAFVKYVLAAGGSVTGNIVTVGGTATGTTASSDIILEV